MENVIVINGQDLVRQFTEIVEATIKKHVAELQQETLPEWVTRRQAAEYFGCSVVTIDNMHNSGVIRKHYINKLPRFKRDELKRAFEQVEKRYKKRAQQ